MKFKIIGSIIILLIIVAALAINGVKNSSSEAPSDGAQTEQPTQP